MSLGAGASVGTGGAGGNTGGSSQSSTGGAGAAGSGAGTAGGANGSGTGDGSGAGTGGSAAAGSQAGQAGAGGSGLGNGGSTGTASWRDGLPDDLKNDATLGKYSDVGNLAKAHIELQKIIGQKNAGAIRKPAADASPEEIKAFRESLGIPTDPTKYDLGKFEGIQVDPKIVQWAQKMGADHGVEPAALKAIITDYMKIEAQNQGISEVAKKEAIKSGLKTLQSEWGDAYDRNIQRANFAAEKLGGQALVDSLVKYGAENDPVILKAFSEAAKLYGESTLREGGIGDGKHSPAELDSEIASVQKQMMDMKNTDGRYPGLRARYESLWKQKTGGR